MGGIDEMVLIAKPAAAKDAMKLEGVKLAARLAWSWSVRRRDRRELGRVVMEMMELFESEGISEVTLNLLIGNVSIRWRFRCS